MIVGWRCAVCGETVGIDQPLPFACPNRSVADPHHVLHLVTAGRDPAPTDDPNPFLRYAARSAWYQFAAGYGLDDGTVRGFVAEVAPDAAITAFDRSEALSRALGCSVWVKDETCNLAGSHKARHLVGILLHLLVVERLGLLPERPPLAIASCGNAAFAAATLARRIDWPLEVFVPTWMDAAFGDHLDRLGARVHRCERRPGDPAGDPAMLRFRQAVSEGAVPFTVQGPENALCLDTGRTIGWEISDQAAAAGVAIDRAVVQVGGGAFGACVGAGLGPTVRLDLVQAEGCAPLAAAWRRAGALEHPERSWAEVMLPWPEPSSAADGILDDETYDWIADFSVMRTSGGEPVVATEDEILRANDLARRAGFDVSTTGSAGLAGVLHVAAELPSEATVAVVMSGVRR